MSSESQVESTNSPEMSTKKSENITSNDNPEIKELLKIPYVKELVVKFDVLKNGMINERKKNKMLENQIKQLEEELNSKTEQIKNISQEKIEIEKQLAIEKKKLEKKEEGFLKMASILNASSQNAGKFCVNPNINNKNKNKNKNSEPSNVNEKDENNNTEINRAKSDKNIASIMAKEKITKLNEQIKQLKFENEAILNKMNSSLEENENIKLEYKNNIKTHTDKINSLEEEIKKLKQTNLELEEKLNLTSSKYRQCLKEKDRFDKIINEHKKKREEAIYQLNACLAKCGKLAEENQEYKDLLTNHQSDATKMAQKLAEYKNMLIKNNLRNQMFHVTKVGLISNNDIDIYFGQDKDGNYVMRIDDKDKIELINMLDVDYISQIDKNNKNKVQISYMYKSKRIRINVIVDDYVIEQFIEAYKNFYSESVKIQNKITY